MVAEALEVKVGLPIPPDAHADGRDHGPHLGVLQGLGEPRLLHVEDLPPEGQDGLEAAVPALLGAPPCRVPLHDEKLRLLGVFRLAVGELSGKLVGLQGVLPADELPRLPRRLPGLGGPQGLLVDGLGDAGVLLQDLQKPLVNHLAHGGPGLGV